MADDDRENFFGMLETRGEAKVRQMLESREWGMRERLVREWLQIREKERMTEQERREIRAVEAAEKSANAAQSAAHSAKDAAKWAMWALIAALLSIAITVAFHYI